MARCVSPNDNATAAKEFLEKQLRNYTDDVNLTLKRSIFDFERCLTHLNRAGFEIVVSEEISYAPFDNREMSFEWMVKSQPLLIYLGADELERFEHLLWQHWQQEQVDVRSHHGLYLAQKM